MKEIKKSLLRLQWGSDALAQSLIAHTTHIGLFLIIFINKIIPIILN